MAGNHFFEGFHFAHTEGATAGIGLMKQGSPDALDDFLRSGQRLSATHHQAVAGHGYREAREDNY